MKKLYSIIAASLISISLYAQGTRFQPGSVPTPVPVYNFVVLSNLFYQTIVSIATGLTNSGLNSNQVSALINDTNVNRIQPVVDSKLAITNSYLPTNSLIDSIVFQGTYKNIYMGNGAFLRTNTSSPFDWEFHNTNGIVKYGTNHNTAFQINSSTGLVTPLQLSVTQMAAAIGHSNFITVDFLGVYRTNDFATFVASIISAGGWQSQAADISLIISTNDTTHVYTMGVNTNMFVPTNGGTWYNGRATNINIITSDFLPVQTPQADRASNPGKLVYFAPNIISNTVANGFTNLHNGDNLIWGTGNQVEIVQVLGPQLVRVFDYIQSVGPGFGYLGDGITGPSTNYDIYFNSSKLWDVNGKQDDYNHHSHGFIASDGGIGVEAGDAVFQPMTGWSFGIRIYGDTNNWRLTLTDRPLRGGTGLAFQSGGSSIPGDVGATPLYVSHQALDGSIEVAPTYASFRNPFTNVYTGISAFLTETNTFNGYVNATNFVGGGAALTSLNASQLTSGTVALTRESTNIVTYTNFPTSGQALVVKGTNTSGQVVVGGTNWPSGSGSSIPSLLGVVTNDTGGDIGVSVAIPFTWVPDGQTAINTASNSLITSFPNRTNYYGATNATAGNAVVIVGPDAGNNFWLKGTNWPTGGGSTPNGLVTNNGVGTVLVPTPFIITNSANATIVRADVSGGSVPYGGVPNNWNISGTTNGSSVGANMNIAWVSPSAGLYLASGAITLQSNGVAGVNGWFYMDGAQLNIGKSTTTNLSITSDGTITLTGGPASLIPTNASPVFTFRNPSGFTLPMGITNILQGRAQPVVQYYRIDGASGVPILTASNETTLVKLTISQGASASITPETNWFTLPITTTNTIWKLRDESTGSGASVGVLTNFLIGL